MHVRAAYLFSARQNEMEAKRDKGFEHHSPETNNEVYIRNGHTLECKSYHTNSKRHLYTYYVKTQTDYMMFEGDKYLHSISYFRD